MLIRVGISYSVASYLLYTVVDQLIVTSVGEERASFSAIIYM